MKSLILALMGALLLLSLGLNAYWYWPQSPTIVKDPVAEEQKPGPIDDPLMQFVPDGWKIASSKILVLEEIYLPFLHVQLAGKKVRIAHIEGAGLKFTGSKSSYVNQRLTRGTVVVLAETGQLLRVVLNGDIPRGPLIGEFSLAKTEQAYLGGGMKFISLPKESPKHSLQQILNRMFPGEPAGGGEEPHKAAVIAAVYVVEKHERFPPDDGWNLHFYDCRVPSMTIDYDNRYMRVRLDADGRRIQTSNSP